MNVVTLPIGKILPNPEQPRVEFDERGIDELASSIAQYGLMQPVEVEQVGDDYILHAGERRIRACKRLGMTEIHAIVRSTSVPQDRLMRALTENIQRANMNPVDEARAYARLRDEFGLPVMTISQKLGVSDSKIHNRLTILSADPEVVEMIEKGELSFDSRVVQALALIPDKNVRIKLAKKAVSDRYSIRTVVTSAKKIAEQLAKEYEAHNQGIPAVEYGIRGSKQKLDLPAWDALVQVGALIPWTAVRDAAKRVCDRCSIRSMANKDTCGMCPLPAGISEMINTAKGNRGN